MAEETNAPAPVDGGDRPRFADLAADAIRYWELRRPVYNLILFAVVLIHFATSWPASKAFLTRDPLLVFFGLAVLANVAYCAAYAIDLFAQFSGMRAAWVRRRWWVIFDSFD